MQRKRIRQSAQQSAMSRSISASIGAQVRSMRHKLGLTGAEVAKRNTDLQAAVFATNSGKRLRATGDLDNAIAQFRTALAATPDYAPAHFELGLALQQQGKKEEARQEFEKAASLDPKLVPSP